MSWPWLFPPLVEQDAAIVAARDDRVVQLFGVADFGCVIAQQREPLQHLEKGLRRRRLAMHALFVRVARGRYLRVHQLQHLGLLVGRAARELLGEALAGAVVELTDALEEPGPLV